MPVWRVTSRNWMGQFDSAAMSGQAKNNAGKIHPVKVLHGFTASYVPFLLRHLFELLEEFLVLFLARTQGHRLLNGLQGAHTVLVFQARHSQEIVVRAAWFQLDSPP